MIPKITKHRVSKVSELHTNNFDEGLWTECRLGIGGQLFSNISVRSERVYCKGTIIW